MAETATRELHLHQPRTHNLSSVLPGATHTRLCIGDTVVLSVQRGDTIFLAASEGLLVVVQFLINEAGADPSPVDRWGGTPSAQTTEHSRQSSVTRA